MGIVVNAACFARCGSVRVTLRFLNVGICASRGVLTLMTANWPLMLVNGFWLALLAMVVNAFFVGYAPMLVNGFATA